MRLLLLGILISLGIASGCQLTADTERDHLVFRYNEHANIASLDPVFARNNATIWATNQLFNGLVQLDDQLQLRPDIAKEWTYNDSTFTYTFTLRDDVWYHKHSVFGKDSTRQVTAHDFAFSFNRLADPAVASPGSWVLQQVDTFYARNDSIFEIQLTQDFPPFLGLLAMRYCSVVPPEAIAHFGNDFRSHPIGTGPFQFKMWEENIKLVFRKNPLYFEKDEAGNSLPYLEAVAISFLPDKQSEFLQFTQGRLDFISGIDASYKDVLLTADGQLQPDYQQQITMIKGPYLNTEFITLQTADSAAAVSEVLFRQAINYAIDRKKLVTFLRNGIGYPAIHGIIPKGLAGFEEIAGYEHNPQKARQLLDSLTHQTGIKNPQITLVTDANYQDIFEYLQSEIERIGVRVHVDIMPSSAIRQARTNGSLEAFRSSWIADYPDAESYLSLFYSKNHSPAGPNYSFYSNPLFDQWYEEAMRITDIQERKKIYAKMDSLVMQSAPIVPLFYDEAVRFTQKNISGLGINPQNTLILKNVKKTKTPH